MRGSTWWGRLKLRRLIQPPKVIPLRSKDKKHLAGSISVKGKTPPTVSKRLFHGTGVRLEPGDLIEPIGKLEEPTIMFEGTSYEEKKWPSINFPNLSKPDVAYATEDLRNAKYFAFIASTAKDEFKPAFVYEVEPIGSTKVKRLYPNNEPGVPRFEHQSPEGFRVIRTVASKDPKDVEATDSLSRLKIFHENTWQENS